MDEYRLLFFSSLNARNKDILRNLMVVTFSLNISYSVHQNIIKWKNRKFSQGATMLTSTGFSSRIPGNLKLLQLAAAVADKITLLELRSSTTQFSSHFQRHPRAAAEVWKSTNKDFCWGQRTVATAINLILGTSFFWIALLLHKCNFPGCNRYFATYRSRNPPKNGEKCSKLYIYENCALGLIVDMSVIIWGMIIIICQKYERPLHCANLLKRFYLLHVLGIMVNIVGSVGQLDIFLPHLPFGNKAPVHWQLEQWRLLAARLFRSHGTFFLAIITQLSLSCCF